MSNIAVINNESVYKKTKKRNEKLAEVFSHDTTMFLIAAMFILGNLVAFLFKIPVKSVMKDYSYDVLVILIVMELFTNLIAETGIMQLFAIKIAELSKGRKKMCLMMFGGMMFFISSCLNNITAVMMILPIVFVLLKTLEVDKKYVYTFFATLLALSNTGGGQQVRWGIFLLL